jgi:hypothetical protein
MVSYQVFYIIIVKSESGQHFSPSPSSSLKVWKKKTSYKSYGVFITEEEAEMCVFQLRLKYPDLEFIVSPLYNNNSFSNINKFKKLSTIVDKWSQEQEQKEKEVSKKAGEA